MRIIVLLAMAATIVTLPFNLSHAQGTACTVDENYIETVEENSGALLRITVLLNTGGGPLNQIETASVNYRQLISMREYHESLRETLPDCAQQVNTELIDTMVAAQDLFGMIFLQELDAENIFRYEDDLIGTAEELRLEFAALNSARNATNFVAEVETSS